MGRDRQITRHHGAASTSGVSHSTLLPVWSIWTWRWPEPLGGWRYGAASLGHVQRLPCSAQNSVVVRMG